MIGVKIVMVTDVHRCVAGSRPSSEGSTEAEKPWLLRNNLKSFVMIRQCYVLSTAQFFRSGRDLLYSVPR